MPDPLKFLTMLPQDRPAMMQPPPGPSGIAGFLQSPGTREGLLMAGLRLLGSDQKRETFGQALGGAVTQGMGAYEQAKRRAEYNTLLNESGMPEETRKVFSFLGPDRGGALLAEGMLAPPPAPVAVGVNQRLVDPTTREVVLDAVPEVVEPAKAPTTDDLTEYDRAKAEGFTGSFAEWLQSTRSPGVQITNTVGDPASRSASGVIGTDAATRLTSASALAGAGLNTVDNIAQAKAILSNPEAVRVFGPASSIRTLTERFRDDPTARQLGAAYDVVTSANVLETIASFKGSLSDKELDFIARASASDRNMTVDELRAGLDLLDRIARRNMQAYLTEFESFDPSAFDVAPQQMLQYINLRGRVQGALSGDAERRRAQYGLTPPPN